MIMWNKNDPIIEEDPMVISALYLHDLSWSGEGREEEWFLRNRGKLTWKKYYILTFISFTFLPHL